MSHSYKTFVKYAMDMKTHHQIILAPACCCWQGVLVIPHCVKGGAIYSRNGNVDYTCRLTKTCKINPLPQPTMHYALTIRTVHFSLKNSDCKNIPNHRLPLVSSLGSPQDTPVP